MFNGRLSLLSARPMLKQFRVKTSKFRRKINRAPKWRLCRKGGANVKNFSFVAQKVISLRGTAFLTYFASMSVVAS